MRRTIRQDRSVAVAPPQTDCREPNALTVDGGEEPLLGGGGGCSAIMLGALCGGSIGIFARKAPTQTLARIYPKKDISG